MCTPTNLAEGSIGEMLKEGLDHSQATMFVESAAAFLKVNPYITRLPPCASKGTLDAAHLYNSWLSGYSHSSPPGKQLEDGPL